MKTPDRRAVLRIKLENLLSFGPDSPGLELENLNILIGPNASGKSNLIEALSLLRAMPVSSTSPDSFRGVVRRGGGVDEWIWKGGSQKVASVDVGVNHLGQKRGLQHHVSFAGGQNGFRLEEERIERSDSLLLNSYSLNEDTYYRLKDGKAEIQTSKDNKRRFEEDNLSKELSILAQLRDPVFYPEFSHLATVYEKIAIYREWTFGRKTVFREAQQADARNDRLEEDFSNLSLFLSRFTKAPKARTAIVEGLKDLYDGFTGFNVHTEGGTVQVFFDEGNISIPARRLSDGTLHYLCLLAILCDPDPPPLICIEEPELGLHPDILPKLADLLVQASERTQLIVTTHSDVLVDCMTDHPESVVICEKREGQTHMRRLQKEELTPWLEQYRLGQLWTSGEIGGNRW